MGQYYKPVSLDKKEWIYTHDFDSGLKLMEHSYVGNRIMSFVENLLRPNGDWYRSSIVWAGDYADHEAGYPKRWHQGRECDQNIYDLAEEWRKVKPPVVFPSHDPKLRYLVNHTKQIYIDLDSIKLDPEGYRIHPLPILTCEGNGRGGGDFRGSSKRVGSWARNSISMEYEVPKGYKKVSGQFKESRQ